jgi:hypothetical protein
MPGHAGIQEVNLTIWIPAFAGMTLEDFSKTDSPGLGHRKFADFHKELSFWGSIYQQLDG